MTPVTTHGFNGVATLTAAPPATSSQPSQTSPDSGHAANGIHNEDPGHQIEIRQLVVPVMWRRVSPRHVGIEGTRIHVKPGRCERSTSQSLEDRCRGDSRRIPRWEGFPGGVYDVINFKAYHDNQIKSTLDLALIAGL